MGSVTRELALKEMERQTKPLPGVAVQYKTPTAALLAERKATHGLYDDDAGCSMRLIDVLEDVGTLPLTSVQRHALHMICHKIARIVTGKADFRDHWDDIAGYATLVAERCGPIEEPTGRNSHPQCRDGRPGRREEDAALLNKPPCYCAPNDCMCDTGHVPKYVYCKKAEDADRVADPYGKRGNV